MKPLNDKAGYVLEKARTIKSKWWIAGGTVLGLARENDFIDGDTDIDIEVEGYTGIDKHLFKNFLYMDLIRSIYDGKHPMQLAFMYAGNIFDIYILWRDGDKMVNHNDMGTMETPAHFYDELGSLQTRYGDYPVPWPITDYLGVRYGQDWHIPQKHKGLYTHAI